MENASQTGENPDEVVQNENKRKSVLKVPYLGKTSELFGRRIKKLIKIPDHEI